jgi:hypothetical protein
MVNNQIPKELEDEAARFLEQEDQRYGKNSTENPIEQTQRSSLGRSAQSIAAEQSTISGANDSYWKRVPLENLPSRGMFYAEDSELTIRAADVAEIRQWSTMDEGDLLDIDDTLNFILEKCCRFKINNGSSWLTWRDILEIDRLFVIFLIHEITFPTGQNELFARFECNEACSEDSRYSDDVKVRSGMLQLFDLPAEVLEWYSQENRCFEINSTKLNETFYLFMPTVGNVDRLRKRIAEIKKSGATVDKAFIKMAPYLIQDWSKFNKDEYRDLQSHSMGWHINKFTFVNKFVDLIREARRSELAITCPNCGQLLTSSLFSEHSFTVKDLFLISGRLNELV